MEYPGASLEDIESSKDFVRGIAFGVEAGATILGRA